jgi:hypothetical protein
MIGSYSNDIARTPSAGPHEITATPYTGSRGSGTQGTPLTVTFTVTER